MRCAKRRPRWPVHLIVERTVGICGRAGDLDPLTITLAEVTCQYCLRAAHERIFAGELELMR